MTQIWIALRVYVLLAFITFQSTLNASMRQILQLLQIKLFEKRDHLASRRPELAFL